jgi:hypothetical protein
MPPSALVLEWSQIHDYARHSFAQLASWFTFYFVINVTLASAVVASLAKGERVSKNFVLSFVVIMAVFSFNAARVCLGASQLFRDAGARAGEIIQAWQKAGVQDAAMTRSPLPLVEYVTATNIMLQTLIVLGILWLLLGWYVRVLHRPESPKPQEAEAKP